jgi:hypothetical protein
MHLNPQPLEVVIAETDGIFPAKRDPCALDEFRKIDRSMPIVAETEQILNRQNSPLNSRVEISDGSERRFFVVCGKTFSVISMRYSLSKPSSGNDFGPSGRRRNDAMLRR